MLPPRRGLLNHPKRHQHYPTLNPPTSTRAVKRTGLISRRRPRAGGLAPRIRTRNRRRNDKQKRSGDGAQRDAGLITPRTPMRTPLTRAQTSKDHCEFRLCVRQGALRCGYLLSCGTSNDTHTLGRFIHSFPFNKTTNVQKKCGRPLHSAAQKAARSGFVWQD